jgi:hypothetical protein
VPGKVPDTKMMGVTGKLRALNLAFVKEIIGFIRIESFNPYPNRINPLSKKVAK